jgi:hypothetical protein
MRLPKIVKPYKPLSVPLLERRRLEQKYLAKSDDCERMAATAYSDMEKEAWLELARDWTRLAKELKEPLLAPADDPHLPAQAATEGKPTEELSINETQGVPQHHIEMEIFDSPDTAPEDALVDVAAVDPPDSE